MRIKKKKALHRWFGKSGSWKRGQIKFILVVFIPIVALFLTIRVYPIISNFSLSFTNAHLIRPVAQFVGFENFLFLFQDKQFIRSFFNTLEFILLSVPVKILLGLIFAVLISRKIHRRKIRFEGFFQTLYFIPYLLPMVPVMLIWKFFFSPGNFGLANYLLELVNLPDVHWMSNPRILLLAIIGIHIWKNLGFFVVVFVMALKAVPSNIIDSAKIDGASEFKTIIHVELPLIRPTLLFGTIMATLFSSASFSEVYIMTQGSDVSSGATLEVLMLRMYQEFFTNANTGRGAAVAVIIFTVALVFVLAIFGIFRRKER